MHQSLASSRLNSRREIGQMPPCSCWMYRSFQEVIMLRGILRSPLLSSEDSPDLGSSAPELAGKGGDAVLSTSWDVGSPNGCNIGIAEDGAAIRLSIVAAVA